MLFVSTEKFSPSFVRVLSSLMFSVSVRTEEDPCVRVCVCVSAHCHPLPDPPTALTYALVHAVQNNPLTKSIFEVVFQ